MDCNDIRPLIDADTDGELDLVRHLALADHLRVCPGCAQEAEISRARRDALRATLPRFTAPPQLAGRIRAALQAETAAGPAAAAGPRRSPRFSPGWSLAGLAASVAFALFVGFSWGQGRARADLLLNEAVNDHIRSLQAAHLTDVASTDQHTVKPWFAGRIDFAPPVTDLAAEGFPLTGGRLEHLAGRPAAALVYHRRQHAINLFIWPATGGAVPARASGRDGYNTASWSQDGFNFLAVSEIPAAELAGFTAAFRAHGP